MNIFNLTEEYLNLISEIEELEGELTPELEERLRINQSNFEYKLRNYRYIILMLNSDINMIKDEIDRLKSISESKLKSIDRLKENMLQAVLLFGADGKSGNKKLEFSDFKLWTTNRESVQILDEDNFNDPLYTAYSTTTKFTKDQLEKIEKDIKSLDTISKSISKTLIKEAIKEGVEVDGAQIVVKPSLTIK
jgi:hypothetical protein